MSLFARSQVLTLSAAKRKDPLRKDAAATVSEVSRTHAAGPSALSRLRTCAAATMTLMGMLFVPQLASACPVCFGGPSAGGKGMNAAIWFLLSVVGFVQIGFVALFLSFWRRAKELRRRRESFQVIEGGVR